MNKLSLNTILSTVAAEVQLRKQIDEGNTIVEVYLVYTKGQKGRKVNIERTQVVDLTLLGNLSFVSNLFPANQQREFAEQIASIKNQITTMSGEIVIARVGYYDPKAFKYHVTPVVMTKAEFDQKYRKN